MNFHLIKHLLRHDEEIIDNELYRNDEKVSLNEMLQVIIKSHQQEDNGAAYTIKEECLCRNDVPIYDAQVINLYLRGRELLFPRMPHPSPLRIGVNDADKQGIYKYKN